MGRVIVLTGPPGAGKTSVAEGVCARLARSAHVPVDYFRKLVKGGYASPSRWSDAAAHQYALARRTAGYTARVLADDGFTVVVDDIVRQHWLAEWREHLAGYTVEPVLLLPSLAACLERNRTRTVWQVAPDIIASLHHLLGRENTPEAGWRVIDTSDLTPAQTVDRVLAG